MGNREWGYLFSGGLTNVAGKRRKTLPAVMADVTDALREAGFSVKTFTVEGYTRGILPKDHEIIAFLARYIKQHGWMGREWFDRFLAQARYPERDALLQDLFGISGQPQEMPRLRDKLPRRMGHGSFVGRRTELGEVLRDLDDPRWPVVSIEGMAGVGKSTLAIEAAYQCLAGDDCAIETPFEAAVWVTAKERPRQFHRSDMGEASDQESWLDQVLDAIAGTLGYLYVTRQLAPNEKPAAVHNLLSLHRVLVILDDYENMEDPELVRWMMEVPQATKVLITSRFKHLRSAKWIHLGGLKDDAALAFTRWYGACMKRISEVPDEQLLPLIRVTEGNPMAIRMALDHVAKGDTLNEMVDALHHAGQSTNDIFSYLFSHAWERLDENARHLLQAVPFFAEQINKKALGAAAGLSGYQLDLARNQLVELSLLDVLDEPGITPQRYGAHSLTRAFAAARLDENPEWEREARQRWVEWYLDFTGKCGGMDWSGWAESYDQVESEWANLQALFAWCVEYDETPYEHLQMLWDDDHLCRFTDLYGHWEERLLWYDWLIRESSTDDERQATRVFAMSAKGWTYATRGKQDDLEYAEEILTKAWEIRHKARTMTQCDIANNLAVLCIRRQQYGEAMKWLDQEEELLANDSTGERLRQRVAAHAPYYRGQADYAHKRYSEAKQQFLLMGELGRSIGWQRAVIYSQNWLADIAIVEDNQQEAERLIQLGLPVAECNKDLRRTAFFKRSYARLEHARGNESDAYRWATQALDLFERLGMQQEIEEMGRFLDQLSD